MAHKKKWGLNFSKLNSLEQTSSKFLSTSFPKMKSFFFVSIEFVVVVASLAVAERDDQRIFGLAEGNEDGNIQGGTIDDDADHR